jgi:hypothetical protein
MFRKKESILFINPDYHCTFFYKEKLIKAGWHADIVVLANYPNQYLYIQDDIFRNVKKYSSEFAKRIADMVIFLKLFYRYKYHFYYGRPPLLNISSRIGKIFLRRKNWNIFLFLSKLSRSKIIYLPSGCRDEFTKKTFSLFDSGNVCQNCAFFELCDDDQNLLNLEIMKRYCDLTIGAGFFESPYLEISAMKWKSLDLNTWNPNLKVPDEFQLPRTDSIRVLHSSPIGLRQSNEKNIKGSLFIERAIENLRSEGYKIEYLNLTNIPINQMRYYQVQADIIVDQLIYGQWGSIGIESMALGKPTVCYLRNEWHRNFLEIFTEYDELPIVQANQQTIYFVLKNLIDNSDKRVEIGKKSREFAEQHFSIDTNFELFIEEMEKLLIRRD